MKNNLQTHIDDFLRYLDVEKNSSKLTIREYRRYLRTFRQWFDQNYPNSTIEDLDMPKISAFRVYLSEKENVRGGKLAKVSQNHYVICLRSFLNFLIKNDVQVIAPSKIELPKTHSRSPKFLDSSQVEKLLAMPDIKTSWGLRDRAILELFYSTGLRVSELFNLNRDSVNLTRKEFSIIGKGSKERLVFVSDDCAKWIEKYLNIREKDNFKPLFVRYSQKRDQNGEKMRLSVSSIERMVKSYIKLAGIPVDATPHTLRHSFASGLLRNGANLVQIKEMLGHASLNTTQIYMHTSDDELRNAHLKYHGARKI